MDAGDLEFVVFHGFVGFGFFGFVGGFGSEGFLFEAVGMELSWSVLLSLHFIISAAVRSERRVVVEDSL